MNGSTEDVAPNPVVTRIWAVLAPTGTINLKLVAVFVTMLEAKVAPIATLVTDDKSEPVTVIVSPGTPSRGVNDAITGGRITVKLLVETTVPAIVATVIGAVTAVAGTTALI